MTDDQIAAYDVYVVADAAYRADPTDANKATYRAAKMACLAASIAAVSAVTR